MIRKVRFVCIHKPPHGKEASHHDEVEIDGSQLTVDQLAALILKKCIAYCERHSHGYVRWHPTEFL